MQGINTVLFPKRWRQLYQLHGGCVPSEHTTVEEFSGTTTVVVFAGGAGLLLLMQPERTIGIATTKLRARSFTVLHLAEWLMN
jgi:hypothetical protein